MEVKVSLDIDQLIRIVNQLPKEQLQQLLSSIRSQETDERANSAKSRSFQLKNPTFDKDQLEAIARSRKAIPGWMKRQQEA